MSESRFEIRAPALRADEQERADNFQRTLLERVAAARKLKLGRTEAMMKLALWPVPTGHC